MIAAIQKLHDSFSVRLWSEKLFVWPYLRLPIIGISTEKGSSLLPKIDVKKLTEKCSVSGRVVLGKWKLQILCYAPNFQEELLVRMNLLYRNS